MENNTGRQLTYGEKYVGITFNPSNIEAVDRCKSQCAAVIDNAQNYINGFPGTDGKMDLERLQWMEAAKLKVLEAQMLMVKAITFKF